MRTPNGMKNTKQPICKVNLSNMKSPDVDDLLVALGKPGKFQMFSFFILTINLWIVMTNHMSSVFFTAKTGYICKVDGNNSSHNEPLVSKNGRTKLDECFVLRGNSSEKCSHWTYSLPDGETTIISEFDLVCDDAYKSDLTTTVYFAGVMIGGIVFGVLADRYGRKRVIIFTLLLSGMISVATFLFRTFAVYIILRFFLGLFMQGVQNSAFILAMEMLSKKNRAVGGVVFVIAGAVGDLLLNLLVFVIKDWKYVQLCTGLLPFVEVVILWFVPESLRWEIVQQNFNEAEAIVERISTFNKLPFPRKIFDEIKDDALKEKEKQHAEKERKANILDVFRSPKLRKISLTLSLLWFTFSAGYFGLAFHISFLFGNKYLNFAISSLLDAAVTSGLLWVVPRYGRRRPLYMAFFICAVANAVCSVIALKSVSSSIQLIGTVMAIIGKSSIGCAMAVGYVFTSELYPTVVRNVSLGMNTFWARVGGMAAPQIFFLGELTSAFVPYTFLTAVTLTSGFLTLLLPETRNKGLSDRMEISMSSLLDQEDYLISVSDSNNKTQCYETSI